MACPRHYVGSPDDRLRYVVEEVGADKIYAWRDITGYRL